MDFKILNWNIAGAKFLELKTKEKRKKFRDKLNSALNGLNGLIEKHSPDVVTLEEIVRYGNSSEDYEEIVDPIENYIYKSFPLIDTESLSVRAKWNKILKDSDWDRNTFFAQGNAMLIKNDLPHFPVWSLPASSNQKVYRYLFNWDEIPGNDSNRFLNFIAKKYNIYRINNSKIKKIDNGKTIYIASNKKSLSLRLNDNETKAFLKIDERKTDEFYIKLEDSKRNIYSIREKPFIERVNLVSGLYFGDRDTEPRAALVAHFVFDSSKDKNLKKQLDIFVVNVHLTTLTMEREGIPDIDVEASEIRLSQLKVIFSGIVSRYNRWRQQRYPERGDKREQSKDETFERYPPVWILTGDFNFTEESVEYETITERMNFMDVIKEKGSGTKASGIGKKATLTLDYVFACPKFISFNPLIIGAGILDNKVYQDVIVSDHYPMVATIPLSIQAIQAPVE